ncbi:MAG: hypothetical protein QW794_06885 [Thermosphaera sp.]
MRSSGKASKLVLLDTCVVRNIIGECINLKSIFKKLLLNIGEDTEISRYVFFMFGDELQCRVLERAIEKIRKFFPSILESFAIDYVPISYSKLKIKYHEKCGKNRVRMIRRCFELGENENCNKEVDSDAFLLITACAEMNDFGEVIIITHDKKAYDSLTQAVGKTKLEEKVKVYYRPAPAGVSQSEERDS